jgi:hypothetical protein
MSTYDANNLESQETDKSLIFHVITVPKDDATGVSGEADQALFHALATLLILVAPAPASYVEEPSPGAEIDRVALGACRKLLPVSLE